jgi:hypothetical protein
MNRFITDLPKTLIAAASLFQAALPVANLTLARASRKHGTIVNMIWRRPQAAAIAIRPANVLMVGLTLGALLTVPHFVQGAKAQQSNSTRERVIRECSLMEKRDSHDPYEGTKTGSRQFVYKACMADHSEVE